MGKRKFHSDALLCGSFEKRVGMIKVELPPEKREGVVADDEMVGDGAIDERCVDERHLGFHQRAFAVERPDF